MPFAQADIDKAAKAALNFYLKNDPIDQIAQNQPLRQLLTASKKPFPGSEQYIVEQLRKDYGSNLQAYRLGATVSYNSRDPLAQAEYPWTNYHDGFAMTEDEMRQNGIVLTDDGESKASQAEVIQLTNLLKEYYFDLQEGAQKAFDLKLHLDGTEGTDDIVGLDALVATAPATGVVGGIDRAANAWWRNYAKTAIAAANVVAEMDAAWRACTKNGGMPTNIICGAAFLDNYRAQAKTEIQRHVIVTGQTRQIDPSVSGLFYKGVELVWDPTFEDIDAANAATPPVGYIKWSNRCYMLNNRHITLRPASGGEWIARHPTRPPEKYVHYRAVTWTGGMTMNRSNAHAVLSI